MTPPTPVAERAAQPATPTTPPHTPPRRPRPAPRHLDEDDEDYDLEEYVEIDE